jgi:hypothetical protein
VLAFSLGVVFGMRELWTQRVARRDDELRQARLVVVTEPVWGPGTPIYVSVHNFSDQPIFDVKPQIKVAVGDDEDGQPQGVEVFFLAPGERREFEFSPLAEDHEMSIESPEVYFMDNSGRRWRRSATSDEPERRFSRFTPVEEEALAKFVESVKESKVLATDVLTEGQGLYDWPIPILLACSATEKPGDPGN